MSNVTGALKGFLADTYALYLKTQNFHWNVKGEMFRDLHLMFEEEYNELAPAVDEIAERIAALGELVPGSFTEFSSLISLKEAGPAKGAEAMVRELAKDNEKIAGAAGEIVALAEEAGDYATADLMTQRIAVHEKAAWMLKSRVS